MKLKWAFIFLLLGYFSAAHSQTVDFSFSSSSGTFCAPQTLTFTQNCTGNPGGFIWNFGNGQSNVHPTDTARYLAAGTYAVSLTGLFADTAIVKTKTITINPPPVISLTANTNSICQPGNIHFTANGSPYISSWQWNFGDGAAIQTTSVNNVIHSYADYGQYTASVKAVTAFGCYATDSFKIEVKRFTVTGHVSPPEGCIPANVALNVITTIPAGDAPQNYSWDFGDGSPNVNGTADNIYHVYNITTPISPHVTITSVQGCTAQFDFSQVAYGVPPINLHAETLSGLDTFCGSAFVFLKAVAENVDSYLWQFGDGAIAGVTDSVISYKYADTGVMHIMVTSLFHGCPGAKDSFDIYVNGVVAKFGYGNTCSNKNTFNFRDISPGIVTHFEWTFPDLPDDRDSLHFNVSHSFPVHGSFPVKLLVKDSSSGCADSVTRVVYTAVPAFSSSAASVCADSLITYTVSNSYPAESGAQYYFVVDGGNANNLGDSVLHAYPLNHGTYADYVIVNHNSPSLCNDTIHLSGATKVTGPVTDFTASPQKVCLRIPVSFTNTSHPFFPGDNIVKWSWDFWDGKTDSVQNPPPHLYASPGQFLVSLTATDNRGCALKNSFIVDVDPIPEMTVYPRHDTICGGRDTAILTAYSIDSFSWSPSSYISCNHCDTIKAYPLISTVYIATATNAGGCSASDTADLKVFLPFHINASPSEQYSCPNIPLPLQTNGSGIITWTPGRYLNDSTIANPVATPDTSVTYHAIVKDVAGCYADTAVANIYVYPLPLVNAGPDRVIAYGTGFTLSPAYGASVQNYTWSPAGDLTCTSCPRPSGTITQTKNYRVEVTNDKGCKAKDDVNIILACEKNGLYLPSAFSPFNGGANNYFYPIARGYKTIKTFFIYNRYGNKVFERKDFEPNIASLGWNGTVKGESVGTGPQAFVWYVEAVCSQGTMVASKGTVLLVR